MNIYDYIILGIVFVFVVLAVAYIVHKRKKGESIGCSHCNGDCTRCHLKNSKKG